jgi:hypothetical protein
MLGNRSISNMGAKNPDEILKAQEKAINEFFALVGFISWFASTIDDKLNDCISLTLGTDIKKTMIVLPESNIRKKIAILMKLLKNRAYSAPKLKKTSDVWDRAYKLFEKRNDIIHAPWIGVFLNPDGTAKGVVHDKLSPQQNQFPETHTSELIELRSEFATCYADVIVVWQHIKNELSP